MACEQTNSSVTGSSEFTTRQSQLQLLLNCRMNNAYAGYTLCTNLDKSGANHESHIVYTQVIHVQFVIRNLSIRNNLFARMVNKFQIRANHAWCIAGIIDKQYKRCLS